MLVLVAVGVMNMAWMVALTAVVFAEKIWRSGQAFGYAVGALMIITALLLPWLPRRRRPCSADAPQLYRLPAHRPGPYFGRCWLPA